MINILNKGREIKIDNDVLGLTEDGRQVIKTNVSIIIPPRSKVLFNTKLAIEITEENEECFIGEFIDDENSPLFVVCETYDYHWPKTEPVIITIYNSSDEEYIISRDTPFAFISRYTKYDYAPVIETQYQYVIFENEDIKAISKTEDLYHYEEVIEPDGTSYIKIIKDRGEEGEEVE
jgi:hypothetical protein